MPLNLEPINISLRRVLILLFCLGWFTLLCWWHRNVVMDDPWITFQYARNLLEGKGLVFNPGERLEGYSNPTWVLVSALGIAANMEPLGYARLVSWLCASTIFFMLVFGWRAKGAPAKEQREVLENVPPPWEIRRDEQPRRSGVAALFLAASYPFAVWTMGGLETMLYALLLFVFAATVAWEWEERCTACSVLLVGSLFLLSVTRPEGAMWVGVLGVVAGLDRWRTRWFVHGGIFLLLFSLYTFFRVEYFGQFVPNTVEAKTGGDLVQTIWAGLKYLGRYVFSASFGFFILLVVGIVAAKPWRGFRSGFTGREKLMIVLLLILGLQLTFVVAVGGDWMPARRFIVPVIPHLCLLAAMAIRSWAFFVKLTIVWFFLSAHFIQARQDTELRWCRWAAKEAGGTLGVQPLIDAGVYLRELGDETALLAATEAGAIAYVSRMRFIDMLGLVDAHISRLPGGLHQKFDSEYVLSLRPDFITLGVVEDAGELRGVWASDREMLEQEYFRREYREIHRIPRIMPTSMKQIQWGHMIIYQRRDYIPFVERP